MEESFEALAGLTPSRFEACVNEPFEVVFSDAVVSMELLSVERLEKRAPHGREEPFTLTFRGPMDKFIPQMSWTVRNETLGKCVFFAVPLGPDESGMLYQVIFN